MFFKEDFKKTVYIASRQVNSDGVTVYGTPTAYALNVMNVLPTKAGADLTVIGTAYSDELHAVGDSEYLKSVKPLDKVYVYASVPDSTTFGEDADYTVNGKIEAYVCTRLVLTRNQTEAFNG